MNSSTSSSERGPSQAGATGWSGPWRRFAVIFMVSATGGLVGVLALLFLIDPFDSGRSPISRAPGIAAPDAENATTSRLENASRGRDPAFQAAIIGNSRIQALEPARLRQATGIPFVSLVVQASRSREQLAVLDWFMQSRTTPPRAIIIGLDMPWCDARVSASPTDPFPFWLYDRSPVAYIDGLFRYSVLADYLPRYLGYLMGLRDRARADGYWDYEPVYAALGYDTPERRQALLGPDTEIEINLTGRFGAAEALAERLAYVPPETTVILVRPPVYVTGLGAPGSDMARTDAACRAAHEAVAAGRPNTYLIDWRVDRPETRNRDAFIDHSHYRKGLARLMEADIAAILNKTRPPDS
ncbi:hypothetical protein [Chelatococcus asaccharovorans]|uniref:Uncharacterized protein n=2 Tax=Chelatococcus asaccharovorans TaxID=28210 RepID=A0A2V3TWS2_9HYPH|nr:hypothetical protein [Chelatococcus asaccharovorans]MBS7704187.1 hypothetical protein [Chelatococcus asaccharovorans]PXW53185.1 hypothetical protein C7450_11461 [Chelatococcus asaccharovorans]